MMAIRKNTLQDAYSDIQTQQRNEIAKASSSSGLAQGLGALQLDESVSKVVEAVCLAESTFADVLASLVQVRL